MENDDKPEGKNNDAEGSKSSQEKNDETVDLFGVETTKKSLMIFLGSIFFAVVVSAFITAHVVRLHRANTEILSDIDICKAGVAAVTYKDNPYTIRYESTSGNTFYYQYYRKTDGSRWEMKCQVDGYNIEWGTRDGPWRNRSGDADVTYTTNDANRTITITEGSTVTTYRYENLN